MRFFRSCTILPYSERNDCLLYNSRFKENKTLKDTSYIADVVDKGDRLIIKEVFHGDLYDSQAVKDGTNIQFRIYYKNQGITEYIILDSKSENESMKNIYIQSIPRIN